MSLRIKMIAAAVAMVASVGANAAVQNAAGQITATGTLNTMNGSSEGLFTAYGNGFAYSFDLADAGFDAVFRTGFGGNVFMNQLVSNTNANLTGPATIESLQTTASGVIFDYALPSFSAFLDQAGTSGIEFNVTFGDSLGTDRWLTTLASPLGSMGPFANFDDIGAKFNIYASAVSGVMTANGSATSDRGTDGWAITTAADGDAYGAQYGNNFFGSVASMDNTGLLGGAVNMAVLYGSSTLAPMGKAFTMDGQQIEARTYLADDGQWHLQIGAVAAVPEPETYAMLLAGLGLIGAVARRRRAA